MDDPLQDFLKEIAEVDVDASAFHPPSSSSSSSSNGFAAPQPKPSFPIPPPPGFVVVIGNNKCPAPTSWFEEPENEYELEPANFGGSPTTPQQAFVLPSPAELGNELERLKQQLRGEYSSSSSYGLPPPPPPPVQLPVPTPPTITVNSSSSSSGSLSASSRPMNIPPPPSFLPLTSGGIPLGSAPAPVASKPPTISIPGSAAPPTVAKPASSAVSPTTIGGTSPMSVSLGGLNIASPVFPVGTKKSTEKNQAKHFRIGAGKVWEDVTLAEWPDDDFRIFVGNLGNDVNVDNLGKAFSIYPSFQKAKVIRDKKSTKTKGFGFVSFSDSQDMIRALAEMNGKYIGSRPVILKASKWKDRQCEADKANKVIKFQKASGFDLKRQKRYHMDYDPLKKK